MGLELAIGSLTKLVRNLAVVAIMALLFFQFAPDAFTGVVDALYETLGIDRDEPSIELFEVSQGSDGLSFNIKYIISGDLSEIESIDIKKCYKKYPDSTFDEKNCDDNGWDGNVEKRSLIISEITENEEEDYNGFTISGKAGLHRFEMVVKEDFEITAESDIKLYNKNYIELDEEVIDCKKEDIDTFRRGGCGMVEDREIFIVLLISTGCVTNDEIVQAVKETGVLTKIIGCRSLDRNEVNSGQIEDCHRDHYIKNSICINKDFVFSCSNRQSAIHSLYKKYSRIRMLEHARSPNPEVKEEMYGELYGGIYDKSDGTDTDLNVKMVEGWRRLQGYKDAARADTLSCGDRFIGSLGSDWEAIRETIDKAQERGDRIM